MKKIMITGCNGQLGRALNRLYEREQNITLFNTDVFPDENITALDITDVDAVLSFVREKKPDAIINCAAHTNVDKCETDIDNAYKINAVGPRNLSIAASETGAKLMHISTDYVFPGTQNRPLTEFDPVGPTSMYGKTKLAGENFVKEFSEKHFIIRTAWLYGDGKNFVKTMLRLAEDHREVGVVKDQYGTPTSAAELAKAVKYLLPTDNYGLFHGTCEGSCSWADFAAEIFRLAGKDTKVNYITTEEFASPTKRPAYSILDNYMLRLTTDFTFAPWQDAIEEYMRTER
ncbi:MAG: dTDP-4-dehydrorhamnose reductase [Lachnospiraceae bacterium]|nr:dTDP-4-dehydrorhamnose reductase [Lachnospiraceae bacterium]